MKKIILPVLALFAVSTMLVSCNGYDDKQYEEVLPYGPTQSATLEVGGTVDLHKVYPTYTGGWNSSDTEVATVNESGIVTAVAEGTTYMNANDVSNLFFKVEVK